jgi:hypothetical protein
MTPQTNMLAGIAELAGGEMAKWLQHPGTQGLIALLALLLGLVAYLYPREPKKEKQISVTDYVVCLTEYERDCGPHDAYIYCAVDPNAEAAKACKRGYSLKGAPQSKPGTKCGVNTFTYLCSNEAP